MSNLKTYVAFIRDHSGSMWSLRNAAAVDYNTSIKSFQDASGVNGLDTVVSVIKCGVGRNGIRRDVINSGVNALKTIPEGGYEAEGSTPLFDAVGDAITLFHEVPDFKNPDVSFLVISTTDGEENASVEWKHKLADEMRRLQATDRWTFVFRVPKKYKANLVRLGVPSGNIIEWDQSEYGMKQATVAQVQGIAEYCVNRSLGTKSTSTFYSDLSGVSTAQVKAALTDISTEVVILPVGDNKADVRIREFIENRTGSFIKGTAFYQLIKPEKAVQDYKLLVIRDRNSGAVYSGDAARDLLRLPRQGTVPVSPGDHGGYDIYVQSTSVNRKLPSHTNILVWADAIKPTASSQTDTNEATCWGGNLSYQVVESLFYYDDDLGDIRWRRMQADKGIKAGDIAGEVFTNGKSRRVRIGNILYDKADVIWTLVYRTAPNMPVNHINGNLNDDSISNLSQKGQPRPRLGYDVFNEKLAHDLSTGKLHWRKARGNPFGDLVIDNTNNGSRRERVTIFGTSENIDDVVWLLMYKKWPVGELRHLNGDLTDCRIDNMAEPTIGSRVH